MKQLERDSETSPLRWQSVKRTTSMTHFPCLPAAQNLPRSHSPCGGKPAWPAVGSGGGWEQGGQWPSCLATGSGSAGKASVVGRWPPGRRVLQPPSGPYRSQACGSRHIPGPREEIAAVPTPSSCPPRGGRVEAVVWGLLPGDWDPPLLARLYPTGVDCPQCAPTASHCQVGRFLRVGSASAAHPTRLETHTKESNTHVSQRLGVKVFRCNEGEGRCTLAEV